MGFEIANHTHTHASVSHLSSVEFINELKYIDAKCDSLKIDKTTSFAYPNYDIDTNALKVLGQCGYQFARAGGSRVYNPLKDHPYLVPSWATDDKNRLVIFDALKLASNGNIVVLTIHGVPDIEHPWVTTSPLLFAEYLEYLHKNHFKVIALKQLAEYINIKKALLDIKTDFKNQLKN
jgi:peptidoglycan/xylan/chitin deacetylase (PgdA/CDA1 family)